jgi:RNA polymerase sigma-70 factor (ECF subfamily)
VNAPSEEFFYQPAAVQVADDGSLIEATDREVQGKFAAALSRLRAEQSDEVLFERIAQYRSESCFAELYARYSDRVYSLLVHMLRTDEDAQDLLQEVFAQVWQKAPLYLEHRGNVAAWILSLARNRAVDELRSRRYRERGKETGLASGDDRPEIFEQIAETSLPDKDLHAADAQREIQSALLELSTVHRSVIDLAYFSDLTHNEIATELQMPVGTVKTKIRQAVLILGKALRPHLG